MIDGLFRKFACDRTGNAGILLALMTFALMFALGIGVDYSMASKRRTRMNAAADAAALDVVTPTMMAKSATAAQTEAVAFFNAQVSTLPGVSFQPTQVTATVTDSTVNSSQRRDVTVSYSATSTNVFSGILRRPTIAIGGSSSASSTVAPNIDFYLMLDTSPSMAIAATQAGINTMVASTPSQGGCAFGCHESSPATDNLGNPGGPTQDNYALARSLGVSLRIDLVKAAVQNLMETAKTSQVNSGAAYRMAGYTFDVAVNNPITLTSDLSSAETQAANISLLQVWSNNNLTKTNANSDEDTNFDLALASMNSNMPSPGNGTNNSGDKPQEVLFIVTDGVSDELSGGNRIYLPFGANPSWCTTIKNRGIRIAVLYTTYYPLPTNAWYNTYIAPEQASIAPTAQTCASPGLFYEVSTGGDISAALTSLFQTAVATARLTN